MSKLSWVIVVLVVLLVIAQFFRPDMNLPAENPSHTIQAAYAVPADVDQIIKRSCYDCHSSHTVWPWYAKLSPSSWLLAHDVNEGRGELSFSEFATYTPRKQANKLKEVCEQVKEGEMPMWYYLPLHPAAKLSDADRQTLCGWANGTRSQIIARHPEAGQARQQRGAGS